MMFEIILAIVLINYLRKSPQLTGISPEWSQRLFIGMMACVALLLFDVIVDRHGKISNWLAYLVLLTILYLIYSQKEFQFAKFLIYAVLPLVVIDIVKDLTGIISPSFYKEWEGTFDITQFFAFVWVFAAWLITQKQRKTLEKERLMALAREKDYKITESLKEQLEVQVKERTAALTKQKDELQHTITELKATQALLVQSEKMASLGELTAGIAHEIQNPLNFVNNFSEVNIELIEEMKEALDKGDIEEAKAITQDIIENGKKINFHGKRADGIVKGMLQHSRSSSGVKEPTDINLLADEYLRLSYHGLRAKDKSFNASMKTDFDESIGKINIVPQDIGRVILNLLTNAFYAVKEKKKLVKDGYEPTVSIGTKRIYPLFGAGGVEIKVMDNGNGIPSNLVEKIFQPFFTTKPTGEGTGLGLSLSYDIIKAHGGELKVETKEGEGTTFIIYLPV
jgi:two-component system, NtrC family, sensor kinase